MQCCVKIIFANIALKHRRLNSGMYAHAQFEAEHKVSMAAGLSASYAKKNDDVPPNKVW